MELRWLFWEVCFKAQKLIILTHKYYLYMWGDYNDITIFSQTQYKLIIVYVDKNIGVHGMKKMCNPIVGLSIFLSNSIEWCKIKRVAISVT